MVGHCQLQLEGVVSPFSYFAGLRVLKVTGRAEGAAMFWLVVLVHGHIFQLALPWSPASFEATAKRRVHQINALCVMSTHNTTLLCFPRCSWSSYCDPPQLMETAISNPKAN